MKKFLKLYKTEHNFKCKQLYGRVVSNSKKCKLMPGSLLLFGKEGQLPSFGTLLFWA